MLFFLTHDCAPHNSGRQAMITNETNPSTDYRQLDECDGIAAVRQ
jgi:hypothetical protein